MRDMKNLATQGIQPNGGALSSNYVSKLGSKEVRKKLRNFSIAPKKVCHARTTAVRTSQSQSHCRGSHYPWSYRCCGYYNPALACNRLHKHPYPEYYGGGNMYSCTAWVLYNENMDYLHCDDLSWTGKTKCKS